MGLLLSESGVRMTTMRAEDLDILFQQLRTLNQVNRKILKEIKDYDRALECINLRLCDIEKQAISAQARQRMNYKELDERLQTTWRKLESEKNNNS